MPSLKRGRTDIHYELHGLPGGQTPLLLTHGFGASGRMWDANVARLARDRRVLTWDMRGHAESDSPAAAEEYGPQRSVEDMLALLDVLGAERAVLGGMSLGGYLSLALCARHPERVAALVLVDTGPGFRSDGSRERWNAVAFDTAAALEKDGPAMLSGRPEAGEHRDAVGLAHTAREVMAQRDASVIESLPAIAVPTLVVVGALDTNFLGAADYMAAKIGGARKLVLDDAGHAANIDAAAAFNDAVSDFLEGI